MYRTFKILFEKKRRLFMEMKKAVAKKGTILAPIDIELNNKTYATLYSANEQEATVAIDTVWVYEQALSYRQYTQKTLDEFIQEMSECVSDPVFVRWSNTDSQKEFQEALKQIWAMTHEE